MKKHRSHFGEGGGVNLNLIITPFLDMAFQILAFFIMTYHPSHFEGHIDGNLLPPAVVSMRDPKSDDKPSDDLPSTDVEPEDQDVLMVTVKTSVPGGKKSSDGEPRLILLKRPANPDDTRVSEEDTWEVGKKKLKEALAQILQDAGGDKGAAKAKLKLNGDADLKHQYMMETYDVCKIAGFNKISFVSPVLVERRKE